MDYRFSGLFWSVSIPLRGIDRERSSLVFVLEGDRFIVSIPLRGIDREREYNIYIHRDRIVRFHPLAGNRS